MFQNFGTVGIVAALSPFFLFFNKIRSYIGRIFSLVVRTDSFVYISANAQFHLIEELIENSRAFKFGNKKYSASEFFLKPLNRFDYYTYSFQEKFWILYNKKTPIFLDLSKDGTIRITYLAKTVDVPKLLKKAVEKSYKDYKRAFYLVKRAGSEKSFSPGGPPIDNSAGRMAAPAFNSGGSDTSSPPDRFIYLSKENLHLVDPVALKKEDVGREENTSSPNYYWSSEALIFLKELEYWINNQSFFTDRNLPYRRGVLLSGNPGTGKSKLVYNACEKLSIPLFVFNISQMTNEDFNEFLDRTPKQSVILIEDIDTVFEGRDNILNASSLTKNLLTFDCLINGIGGAQSFEGRFIVVTTNNIEKLDRALLRPGRLDKHLVIGNIGEEGRWHIANNILKGFPDLINEVVGKYGDCPAAEFENYCIMLVTDKFWEKI